MRAGKKHWNKGFSLLRFAFCLLTFLCGSAALRYTLQ
jgi:hypothetical protein